MLAGAGQNEQTVGLVDVPNVGMRENAQAADNGALAASSADRPHR